MNDKKFWLIISAISGITAVAIGAFGAHGLREKLSAEMLEVYKTGVFYQFIHTVVLLVLSLTNFIQARIASFFFRNHIFLIFTLYLLNIRNSIFCNDHANRWSMFSDRMAFANY